MWMALSKIAVCFMTAYGRGQDAAKHLLLRAPEGVLITDQYAGYNFIDPSRRKLCWRMWHAMWLPLPRVLSESISPSVHGCYCWRRPYSGPGTDGIMVSLARHNTCADSGTAVKAG